MAEPGQHSVSYLVHLALEEHDQTLNYLYASISPMRPGLLPSHIGDVLADGVQAGLIAEREGVFHWKIPSARYSAVQRWGNWMRALETPHHMNDTHRQTEQKLAITLSMAREAIAELQGQLAERSTP